MNKDLIKWAKGKVEYLRTEEKKNRKRYSILTIIISILNLIIVILASMAIHALITSKEKMTNDHNLKIQLVMACIAAGVTILIFLLTIFNMVYRSVTKKEIYRKALDEIQVEIIKYKEKHEDYFAKDIKDPEQLLKKNVEKINTRVKKTHQSKHWFSMIITALSGGENA